MEAKLVALGFGLYILAGVVAATVVAPNIAWLSQYFSVFGIYAGLVFGSAISFPVFLLFLWAAWRADAGAEIPFAEG